jgi:hypothetical protein
VIAAGILILVNRTVSRLALSREEGTMSNQIKAGSDTADPPRFDSPLSVWIAIWQRQLVNGSG